MRLKVLVCAVVLFLATIAAADTTNFTAVGSGVVIGSWAQTFNEAGVGPFNQMQFTGISGSLFETPGANNYSVTGWNTIFSSTGLVSFGPFTSNMNFNLDFVTAKSTPLSFYGYAYNGGNVVDAALFDWSGSNWTITATTAPAPPAVPEPASMLLLGSGLAALAAGIRKRS